MNEPLSSVTTSILFLMIVGMNFKLNDNIFKNTIKKKGKMLIRYQLFKFYDFMSLGMTCLKILYKV